MKLYATFCSSRLRFLQPVRPYWLICSIVLQTTFASGQDNIRYASSQGNLTPPYQTAAVNGPACNDYNSRTTANGLGTDLVISTYAVGNTIYAGTGGSLGGVAISTDGGNTFSSRNYVNSGLGGSFVLDLYVTGNTIYAATDGGLGISTDGGNTFSNKTTENGLGDGYISGVYIADNVIYAATGGGLGISTDGGNSFVNKTTADGLGNNFLLGVTATNGILYVATVGGLSISGDGGNTFLTKTTTDGLGSDVVNKTYVVGNTIYAATFRGLSISTDGGNSFVNKTTANGLGNDRINSVSALGSTVYAATEGGLSISTDGGNSFTNYTAINGLGALSVAAVYATDRAIYAGTRGGGIAFCPGSDLTPLLYARPALIYGSSIFSVVVDVIELNSVATNGSFSVRVTKDQKIDLAFDPNLTQLNGRSVQNNVWSFNNSNPNYYILTTSQSVAAGDRLSFGLTGNLSPGASTGVMTVSSTVLPATLAEAKLTNNIDADKVEYFQQ